MATILTDSNFAEIQAQGLPLVIDFSATWCGPCKKIAPIIDELAGQYEGKAIVCKCDVDECDDSLQNLASATCPPFSLSRMARLLTSTLAQRPNPPSLRKSKPCSNII